MLVSIIMPSYNSSSTIFDAINSVLSQTYKNWELIIVDDHSTDSTCDVIKKINDDRIRLISLPSNSGSPAKPRNVAIKESKGQYIAFLDSDDLWYPTKLELQVDFMIKNGYKFTCTAYSIVDSNGNFSGSYTPPGFVTYGELLFNNSIGCLTVIVQRELIKDFVFPICGHEDYALWLKLIKESGGVFSLPEKLSKYRISPGSVSSNKYRLVPFFWHIYRNQEGFGVTKSLYCCIRYFINVFWFKYN